MQFRKQSIYGCEIVLPVSSVKSMGLDCKLVINPAEVNVSYHSSMSRFYKLRGGGGGVINVDVNTTL
jgi:hypothetical protein